jgi:hypothetical protein
MRRRTALQYLLWSVCASSRVLFAQWPTNTAKPRSPQTDSPWPSNTAPDGSDHPTSIANSLEGRRGCGIRGVDADSFGSAGIQISERCGIPFLDKVMPAEAELLSDAFGVSPGFVFLNDLASANAFATPESIHGGSGTVLFGLRLLRQEIYASAVGGNALILIMAHEWGHILQYDHGLEVGGTRMELSADFMGGWWLGYKALMNVPELDWQTAARSLFGKGDYAFNSPQHHGTPAQRVMSAGRGFALAASSGVDDARIAFREARKLVNL